MPETPRSVEIWAPSSSVETAHRLALGGRAFKLNPLCHRPLRPAPRGHGELVPTADIELILLRDHLQQNGSS